MALAVLLLAALAAPAAAATYRIGIVQLVEHPALDASREGFLAELRDTGFIDQVEILYQNAQNDPSLLAPIVNNFINERVDLIHAITTPAAQTAASLARDIPVLFSAVRDPLAAKLIDSFEAPGGNITGSSHYQPASEQAALILEVLPNVRRVRSEEHTSELQSRENLVCRLLLEKKKIKKKTQYSTESRTSYRMLVQRIY